MTKQLLLVRHGSTGPAYKGCLIGSSNVEVDKAALEKMAPLARLVASFRPEHFFCSPLLRTLQTAEKINRQTGLEIEVDEKLREIDFGRWEKLTFRQITAQDPSGVDQWSQGRPDFKFPAGEQIGAFHQRVQQITQRLIRLSGKSILVVTHGGVIRTMICQLLGLEPNKHLLLFDVRPSTLAVIDVFENRGVLTGLNLGIGEC